jgi:hypothetical protein
MVDKVSERTAKFLMWLVGSLLVFCSVVSVWGFVQSQMTARDLQTFKDTMPERYVRYERYKTDCDRDRADLVRLEEMIKEVSNDIKKLLSRRGPPDE